MAPRATWKGFLKLSLVSVPVKAYTATASDGGEIRLNQLHAQCNSRIKYRKICPIHGEVANDEIVSGYEYAKDQYVVVDTSELEKLRTEDPKAITLDEFIAPEALDPAYYKGATYYLVPDGPIGQRPYAVLHQGLVDQNRYGVARMVLHGKEQVVLLRPIEKLLAISPINFEHQITRPATFDDEVPAVEMNPEELQLIETLIDASTHKKFDLGKYKDVYTEKLTQLIEAKVAGKEIVAPPEHEHAHVINLMDALKQSVEKVQKTKDAAEKPPAKMAPSKKPRAEKKKKSS